MPYTPSAVADPDNVPADTAAEPGSGPRPRRDPLQELQVRKTAQRLLATHVRRPTGTRGEVAAQMRPSPQLAFWPGISLDLAGATLVGFDLKDAVAQADFRRVTFSDGVWFGGATFTDFAEFVGATFAGGVWFGGAMFTDGARFDRATFGDGVWFDEATFTDGASFDRATFSGYTRFVAATFAGYASFDRATFTRARFDGATYTGGAGFGGAMFNDFAEF